MAPGKYKELGALAVATWKVMIAIGFYVALSDFSLVLV
jgi:hypothetical protein